jgi:hypothetical protein
MVGTLGELKLHLGAAPPSEGDTDILPNWALG